MTELFASPHPDPDRQPAVPLKAGPHSAVDRAEQPQSAVQRDLHVDRRKRRRALICAPLRVRSLDVVSEGIPKRQSKSL